MTINDFASGINDQSSPRALGGFWNPAGPKESATTHIIPSATLLQNQPEPMPSAVDNSAGLPPVGDQESQGSCTAWALGYYHTSFIENKESPVDLTRPENQVSPAFLHNIANGGISQGSSSEDIADILISNGACSMAEMPYDCGDYSSWPAEDWIWISGMKRKAISQNYLELAVPSDMGALKTYIANGNTAVIGIYVWDNFDNIENYNNTYCSSEKTGFDRGGHSVTICGYDDDKPTADGMGAFRMVNSWGTDWGDAGYWWMTYEATQDPLFCSGWAMYMESETDYSPKMVAKIQIDHNARGDIIRNSGLTISVWEGGNCIWGVPLLGRYDSEDWYGTAYQNKPFPNGKMAFDITEALPLMDHAAEHQFTLSLTNTENLDGALRSFEILIPEWWEGGISWDVPLAVLAYATVQTEAWVLPNLFTHTPLRVNDNVDLAHHAIGEFWQGDGSVSDPFIIPDYYIWGAGVGNCIYIGNTTSNFIISDCWVDSASSTEWSDYNADSGIFLNSVSGGVLEKNRATTNLIGIYILYSTGILLDGNVADGNSFGLIVSACNNTEICQNNVSANTDYGILIETSFDVKVYHNNLINNTIQAYDDTGLNAWDDSYPSGGNYWDDYTGTDEYSGPGQDAPGSDSIGDLPYTDIAGGMSVQDHYPMTLPWIYSEPLVSPHVPLRIDSNADFNKAHGVANWDTGNGTETNPWIIENWDIDGAGYGYCIYVGNTTDHFTVRNNILHGASGEYLWPYFVWVGLTLSNVENCTAENNLAYGNDYDGILLNYSRNNRILNNTAHSNAEAGIFMWDSDYNLIAWNNLSSNYEPGISMWISNYNQIAWNNLSSNGHGGIEIVISENNTFEWNIMLNNHYRGFYMWNSSYNVLRNNNIRLNEVFGLTLDDDSSYNQVYDNIISENIKGAIEMDQATCCDIFRNQLFLNNGYGITLHYCCGNNLYDNSIYMNSEAGIMMSESSVNNISSNYVGVSEDDGIYLYFSPLNRIAGNTLLNSNYGIYLYQSSNSTITGNTAFSNYCGIYLLYTSYSTIMNNTVNHNTEGLSIYYSDFNQLSSNKALENELGIQIAVSIGNVLTNNSIALNDNGLSLFESSKTKVHHNNFINNVLQAFDNSPGNWWNDSYPSGGNYWSDYSGVDAMSGPLQNIPGSDVIGDTSYIIDIAIVDNYPQMGGDGIFIMNLAAGWNLISIPLILDNNDVQDVLACIDGAWDVVKYYDNNDKNDPWKTYRQGASTNDLVELDNKKGYWVHATKSCNLMVFGYTPITSEITLYAGWNLVAYPSLTERTVGDALWGTGADHVEAFNAVSPFIIEVGPTYMMKPGDGYWVHVPYDTVWTINP